MAKRWESLCSLCGFRGEAATSQEALDALENHCRAYHRCGTTGTTRVVGFKPKPATDWRAWGHTS